MIADLKYKTILSPFCSKNKKKYLPHPLSSIAPSRAGDDQSILLLAPTWGRACPAKRGGWGKVNEKSCFRRKQLYEAKNIFPYKLKSLRVSGYSLLSTFALISLKALIVYSTSSRVWAAVGIRRSMTTSLGTTG